MNREKLGSRLGFIMLSAGCAIGCGNAWKFPWMCGQYGGGSFMLVYIICLIVLGIPCLIMEFSVGRAAQTSPIKMYRKLEKPKQKWGGFGWACLVGILAIMAFYTVVCGWIIYYFINFLTGNNRDLGFTTMIANPSVNVIFMMITVVIAFVILSFNIQGGLERITKYMMIALLALMIVLAIHSLFLSGSGEGMTFYLKPDFSKINGDVVVGAMNQAFFSLSTGMGGMAIFGSYIGKDHSLMGEAINVISLDTLVALLAGIIIFPACFPYGVEPNQGPALIFVTLPNVFVNMAGGRIWGTLFFMFMTFACFSTVIAVFENLISFCIDMFNMSRTKSVIINAIIMLIGCLPCIFGFNLLSGFNILGKGVLDIEDFAVSNILLPVGAFLYSLFCSTKFGWGFDGYLNECNQGEGIKFPRFFKPYIKYVLPVLVLIVFISGFIPQG